MLRRTRGETSRFPPSPLQPIIDRRSADDRHAAAHRRSGKRDARARRGLGRRAPRGLSQGDRRAERGAALLPDARRRRQQRRSPNCSQGRHLDEGRAHHRGLEDPRGLRAGVRLDRRRSLQGGGVAAAGKDEHRRVRNGLVDGELRLRPVAEPLGSHSRSRRFRRRVGRSRVRRPRSVGARFRHGRIDQAAVGPLRQRRAAPDVRHRLALRDRGLRFQSRPGRAGDEDRARQRAPLRDHQRAR